MLPKAEGNPLALPLSLSLRPMQPYVNLLQVNPTCANLTILQLLASPIGMPHISLKCSIMISPTQHSLPALASTLTIQMKIMMMTQVTIPQMVLTLLTRLMLLTIPPTPPLATMIKPHSLPFLLATPV
jgi:hypothetical protein